MNVKVITVSDRAPTAPYYILEQFKESLRRLGVVPVILGWGEPWGGLMTKPKRLRTWLQTDPTAKECDLIIVVDAWDIIFVKHPDDIAKTYMENFAGKVVFNGERCCFPRGDLAEQFEDKGTPWRYVNSGFMMGKPEDILTIIQDMGIDAIGEDRRGPNGMIEPNDQEHYTLAYLRQPVPMVIDSKTQLCMACHGSSLDDISLGLKNNITGEKPGVWHFNGDAKNFVMPAILKTLNIPYESA